MGDFSSEPAEEKKKEEAPQLPPEQRGTPVTKENFVTWNAPFMVELRGRSKQVVKTGLSGRELFEGGLWKEPEPEPDEEPMVELDDGAKNPTTKSHPMQFLGCGAAGVRADHSIKRILLGQMTWRCLMKSCGMTNLIAMTETPDLRRSPADGAFDCILLVAGVKQT